MIKQVLKQIWTLRFSNIWLWAELFIVSVCLWYIVDYLYVTVRLYTMPIGFDIENTYGVKLHSVNSYSDKYDPAEGDKGHIKENMLSVVERIKAYPGVETVCASDYNAPYSLGYSSGMKYIDTTEVHGHFQNVSPEYFEVFKIKDKNGNIQPLLEAALQPNTYIVTYEGERQFLEQGMNPLNQPIRNWGESEPSNTLRAVTSEFRKNRFENYYPNYFYPASQAALFNWHGTSTIISFRVSPEADTLDFIHHFREAMTTQLRIGNIYLLDVYPYSDARESYYQVYGIINELKTRLAVLLFLLINIFMGLIGTFWVRTQQRRSEIGLRMALGASKKDIQLATTAEGILLFSLIILPAAFLSYYLQTAEVLVDYRLPVTFGRFILVYCIVCGIVAGMITLGIYFPVKQATKIKPVDVLHEE